MDYKSEEYVTKRINQTFRDLISDIPDPSFREGGRALVTQEKGGLISYEEFCNIVYSCILRYIPKEGENSLLNVLANIPRFSRNVIRIKNNSKIKKTQKIILDKYFYSHGDHNIKDKIMELREAIDEMRETDDEDMDLLDDILDDFEGRMRQGLLTDMAELCAMIKKRDKGEMICQKKTEC